MLTCRNRRAGDVDLKALVMAIPFTCQGQFYPAGSVIVFRPDGHRTGCTEQGFHDRFYLTKRGERWR